MRHQHLIRWSLIALVTFALTKSSDAEETSSRPNVLMICIDDLNDWIGCLGGHPDVQTPHIDKLAASGTNFVNAHCVVPVCSPSRVSIMSGQHAITHGSYDLGPSYQSIDHLKNVPCMQAYFKQHGYITLAGGKVLHHGFTGYLKDAIDINLGKHGGPRPKKMLHGFSKSWDWGAFPETDDQMFDYQLAKNASAALQKEYDRPFFMSVGIFRPHVPMYVPPKWFAMYDREKITLPRAPLSDLEDLPPNFKGRLNIEPTHAEVVERGQWREMVQAYLACVSFADMCVGEILQGLESSPHKDNTVIVLWSDHGFHLGEKQHWAKRTLWEESTRTPLIFAGVGSSKKQVCHEAVSLLDIYPTLVELCQIPKNKLLDGVSLAPQLLDSNESREHPVLSSSYYGNHSLRTKDWRYIRYADGAEELYDHRTDSDEFTNLAGDPKFVQLKKKLAAWLPERAAEEVKGK